MASTLVVSCTVFEILWHTIQSENNLFSHPTLREPVRISWRNLSPKTRGMGLKIAWSHIPLSSTIFDWSTRVMDGQTDRRAIVYHCIWRAQLGTLSTSIANLLCMTIVNVVKTVFPPLGGSAPWNYGTPSAIDAKGISSTEIDFPLELAAPGGLVSGSAQHF